MALPCDNEAPDYYRRILNMPLDMPADICHPAGAGKFEEANRIVLMTYDDNANFTNACRYVLEPNTIAVKSILHSHIPEEQRKQNQFTLSVEPDQLVSKDMHVSEPKNSSSVSTGDENRATR